MQLSIIIVSFNTKELLADCLSSIVQNNQKEVEEKIYEIIVVDNGSTDGSPEMINKKFSTVKIIHNRNNIGFGVANNQGVKIASGEYILFLNPDTKVPKQTLVEMLEFIERQPMVGVATCKVVLPSGDIDDASHRGFPTPWRALTYFLGLGSLFPHSQLFNGYHLGYRNLDTVHEIDACTGAFLLIRRSVGDRVGWYDKDYFWYGEDLDLCFRVKTIGFKVMYVPNFSIFHIKGAASGFKKHSHHLSNIDTETKKQITQARFDVMRIFYRKHYSGKYPKWLTKLVFLGIDVKQKLTKLNPSTSLRTSS